MKLRTESVLAWASIALAAAVAGPLLLWEHPWPIAPRDFLLAAGFAETGATNLVSAIYLGYRAYDTLGETVVLLASLAGAMGLVMSAGSAPPSAGEPSPARGRRTDIIDLTVGKLAPIVLLFGWYVMFYGHQSPGGGFQGGVVLASGIVFIAIGRREGGLGRIDARRRAFRSDTLAKVEALAFMAILALSVAGPISGSIIMGNPIPSGSELPQVAYIVAFNAAIGLKVGSGVALICLLMMGGSHD